MENFGAVSVFSMRFLMSFFPLNFHKPKEILSPFPLPTLSLPLFLMHPCARVSCHCHKHHGDDQASRAAGTSSADGDWWWGLTKQVAFVSQKQRKMQPALFSDGSRGWGRARLISPEMELSSRALKAMIPTVLWVLLPAGQSQGLCIEDVALSGQALLFVRKKWEQFSISYSIAQLWTGMGYRRREVEQMYFISFWFTILAKNWQVRSCVCF